MPMTAHLTLCLSSRGGLRHGTMDLIHRAAQPSCRKGHWRGAKAQSGRPGLHGLRLVMMSLDEGLGPPRGFQTGRQQARRGPAGSGKIRSARPR